MMTDNTYYLTSRDANSMTVGTTGQTFTGTRVHIPFKPIFVIVGLILLFKGVQVNGFFDRVTITFERKGDETVEASVQDHSIPEVVVSSVQSVDSTLVIGDSDRRYLTRDEIIEVCANSPDFRACMRRLINDIYARRGQFFEAGGVNDVYYSSFDWYAGMEKRDLDWEDFNPYESANITLLVDLEREFKFRK